MKGTMKKIARIFPVLLLAALCGCFQVKDELTIQADGSGTVHLETRSAVPSELTAEMGMAGRGAAVYPPTTEAQARGFFPGPAFKVTVKQTAADDGTLTVVDVSFTDINALLASPYGRAHALSLKLENGTLKCRAVSGLELAARTAEVQDNSGEIQAQLGGLADLSKKKMDMRDEFHITLPNPVTDANGTRDNKTVIWIAEHSKITNADDYAAALGKVLEASCPATGLTMAPVTPPRMLLSTFKDLSAGVVATTNAGPDTQKIAAAAHFVPYALHLARTVDLSGEGGGSGNQAQLVGAVVLPKELAPQKWGEVKLTEAVDSKGANLKPKDNEGGFMMNNGFQGISPDDEDNPDPDAKPAANDTEERHQVAFQFRPPDWKTKEIARLKGSVEMLYFGGLQIVKLSNSIPAKWIMSPTSDGAINFNDAGEKNLTDPALEPLGLALACDEAMIENGMTVLILSVKGKADIAEAQVFDAAGKAWPTVLQNGNENGADGSSLQLMVAGKPAAPLSLALVVSSAGTSVDVPISLEHVPVTGN